MTLSARGRAQEGRGDADAARRRRGGAAAARGRRATTALTEAQRRAAELAQANALLAEQQEVSAEGQRQVALLNQQTAAAARAARTRCRACSTRPRPRTSRRRCRSRRSASNLNAALARVAVEERRRADLEAEERERLEAEAKDLERYRSEFFGRMRDILGEREGVQVVGDRFVFPSEVLFAPGSATLGGRGPGAGGAGRRGDPRDRRRHPRRRSTGCCASTATPTRRRSAPTSPFADNWELSQARALSVVRYMTEVRGPAGGPAGRDRLRRVPARSTPATAPRRWRATGGSS